MNVLLSFKDQGSTVIFSFLQQMTDINLLCQISSTFSLRMYILVAMEYSNLFICVEGCFLIANVLSPWKLIYLYLY